MNWKIGFGITLALVASLDYTAPAVFAQTYPAREPLAQIEKSMQDNLTWNLENALLLYYPETKFVVKADVALQKEPLTRVLPKLPDALLSRDLSALPGLPYLPEDLHQYGEDATSTSAAAIKDYVQGQGYSVGRIQVHVLVDRSFSENDWAFIRRLVTLTADLDPRRGDQVRVEALNFPVKADFLSPPPKPAAPTPDPAPQKLEPQVTRAGFDWRPWLFSAGVSLLLLLLFLYGLRTITKSLQHIQASTPVPRQSEPTPTPASRETEPRKHDEREQIDQTVAQLKSATIDAIVGTPVAASKVFQQWLDHHGQQGYQEAAIVLNATSKQLIDLVAPYLGPEAAGNVQLSLDSLRDEEVVEKSVGMLKQFDTDLRHLALQSSQNAEENDALAFLYQMSDEQLQHLLKPLKTGVMAIVLAQLRPDRVVNLLNKLAPPKKQAVLAAMGNIERIPTDVYQHIARQLAGRARELERMRFVRANGVDALVDVLEYMDEGTQEEVLHHLQSQDMDVARKVRSRFITFNQVLDMPPEDLRDLALQVDRDLLAKSLVSVDDAAVRRIITALPERLGEMVVADLEAQHDLSNEEVARARQQLLHSWRTSRLQRRSQKQVVR